VSKFLIKSDKKYSLKLNLNHGNYKLVFGICYYNCLKILIISDVNVFSISITFIIIFLAKRKIYDDFMKNSYSMNLYSNRITF